MENRFSKVRVCGYCNIKNSILIYLLAFVMSVVSNATGSVSKSVPEEMYQELLQMIELQSKANYEKINSWQGKMNIVEKDNVYGEHASQAYLIRRNSPAANSKNICRIVNATVEFACDFANDKLYCNLEPTVRYRAVDLNVDAETEDKVRYSRIRSVITPQEYLSYEPDHTFSLRKDALAKVGTIGKAVFRELPQKSTDRLMGDIRDPRDFFNCGATKKIWEVIHLIRETISIHGNPTVAGHPFLNIVEIGEELEHKEYEITTVYRTSRDDEKDYRKVTRVVDEKVDFNITKFRMTDPSGMERLSVDLTYKKIGDASVPKSNRKVICDSKGRSTFDSQIELAVSIINEPIPERTFTYENLDLENGVRFIDNIRDVEYIYKDGELLLF